MLALNANCHYCEDSVPFYQNLAAAIRQGKERVDAVALFPNEAETVRQFTAHEGMTMRSVPGVPLEKLRINATPTVILVNNQGWVERSWVGILTPRQENDLLKLAAGL